MCTTMPLDRFAEVHVLLRTYFCNRRRTRTHGTNRQVSLRTSDVRIATTCQAIRHQPRQGKTAHARPAHRCNISETKNDDSESGTQEISVFIAQRYSVLSESHLVDGHHVHRFGSRIRVLDGDHRLVQPHDIIVAIIEHDGRRLLRGLSRRGVRLVRRTGIFQQRPGKSVHLQTIFGQI